MQEDTLLTLAGTSEGSYKEKGSKFIAFAYPVKNEAQVKENLCNLKKDYHDARHHCYAYILGKDQAIFRANDGGEPNHSAGDPILGQIRSKNLTDVLVVVVRYFGGTKLGLSGLVNAYKTATASAIENGRIVEEVLVEKVSFQFNYTAMNEVMRMVKELDLEVVEQDFQISYKITLLVRLSLKQVVMEKLDAIL